MSFKDSMNAFVADEIRKGSIVDRATWKRRQLTDEDEIVVTDIRFIYGEAGGYSSWTMWDASFDVIVKFELNGEPSSMSLHNGEIETMGDFLNKLLAHEDAQ